MAVPAIVRYSFSKNCLAHVSASLLCSLHSNSRDGELAVAKVTCAGKTCFFSLIPISSDRCSSDEVRLNGLYASKMGIADSSQALVELVKGSSVCISAWIEPLTVDDWEIVELHGGELENQLLDQIRVIWPGQVFPLWVEQNVCIYMKVVKTEPASQCCVLIQLTQLFVEPKVDLLLPEVSPTPEDGTETSIAAEANPSEPASTSSTQTDDSLQSHRHGRYRFFCRIIRAIKFILEYIWKYLLPRACHHLRSLLFSSPTFDSTIEYSAQEARRARLMKYVDQLPAGFQMVMRVELVSHGSSSWYDQPSTVFLRSFDRNIEPNCSFLPVMHLIKVSKVLSPKEKLDEERKSSKHLHTGGSDVAPAKRSERYGPEYVVRMYTHPSSRFAMTCDLSSLHALWLPTSLRRQLKAGLSSKVRLQKLGKLPEVCDNVKSITFSINSSNVKLCENDHEKLTSAFSYWLSDISDSDHPLPITEGAIICFPVENAGAVEELVKRPTLEAVISSVQTNTGERPDLNLKDLGKTYLLCSDDLKHIEIMFKYDHKTSGVPDQVEVDFTVPAESVMVHCDGFEKEVDALTRFLEVALLARPIPAALGRSGVQAACVLVTGQKGTGKTTLCRAMQRKFSLDPLLQSYSEYVACGQLRGKKTENVRRKLNLLLSEALWRQPSVLLLDDLDQLVPANSSTDDRSPDAVYTLQLVSVVQNFFKSVTSRTGTSRVAVIVTTGNRSSIHPGLIRSSNHFFTATVSLGLPDTTQRFKMLKSIVERCSDLNIPDNLDDAIKKMEGYTTSDMVNIARRSAHLIAQKKLAEVDAAMLTAKDLLEVVRDYTPVSLQNADLHKPAPMTWRDVGGLHSVKQKLVEQLIWPLKYKHVFVQCGLESEMGILLFGPPGCGKTLVAGVLANECSLNFITVKGPELLSKYIGASEAAVRDVFSRAKSAAPCILFFDEFDSLAPRRGHDSTGVTDRVVNQLLTHLDGVEPLVGVTVVAASSRPDLLDPALLRPGRLDNLLYCPLPTETERLEILQCLSTPLRFQYDVDLHETAVECENFSGADLKALLCNAQLEAIHDMCGFSSLSEKSQPLHKSATSEFELYSTLSSRSTMSASTFEMEVDDLYQSNGFAASERSDGDSAARLSPESETKLKDAAACLIETLERENAGSTRTELQCDANNYRICFDNPVESFSTSLPDRPVVPDAVDIVHFPSMHQGPCSAIPQSVKNCVKIVYQSLTDSQLTAVAAEPTVQKQEVIIKPHHIRKALQSTRPSLSAQDREKFQELYSKFIRSRDRSDLNKPNYYSGKQRATLS